MENYRQSINTPRHRSFVQRGRVNEDLISRVNYQNQKNSFYSILKFAIIFILIILFFFITGKLYNSISNNNYQQNFKNLIEWVGFKISKNSEKGQKIDFQNRNSDQIKEEIIYQNKEPKYTEEELLRRLGLNVKECREFKKLKNDLRYQKFSISYNMPFLPNFEQIKQNPGKYGISNDINRQIFSEELPNQNKLRYNLRTFNEILPYGEIDLNSDAQDFRNVNGKMENGKDKYEPLNQFLDDEYVYKIQKNVNDIGNSYKNLLEKQKRLNSFRKVFVDKMNELKTCKINLFDIKSENDKKKDLEADLNINLKDLNNKLKNLLEEIDMKNNLLNVEKRKRRLELSSLKERIQDLEMYLINKNKIRSGFLIKRSEIEASKRKIANLEREISDNNFSKGDLKEKIIDLNIEIPKLKKKIDILKKTIEINSAKLQVLQKNSKIKQFLDTLINKNVEVDDLAIIMQSKIGDEKELLKEFQLFYDMISKSEFEEENREGVEVTFSIEGDANSIKENIDNDKKNYKEISSKFLALRRELDKYENIELSINKNVVKIQNFENDLRKLIEEIAMKTRLFKQLGEKLKNIDYINLRKNEEIENLRKLILRLELEIENDEKKLFDAEFELEKLRNEFKILNNKFNQDFSGNKEFEKLENEKHYLRKRINEILEKLRNLKKEIDEKNLILKAKTNECAILLLFFNETSKAIPTLVSNFESDKGKMNDLKRSIIEKINLFDNFN